MDCSEEKASCCFDVVVVGACFCDLLTYVPKYPKPGETAHGRKFMLDFGGKGANMCIMARKLGAKTAMVSIVGHDVFGRETIGNFKKFGVNTSCIVVHKEAATGITNCIVDDNGEPSFISIAGATKLLTTEHIDEAKCIIEKGKVLITNKGIPLATALAALKLGKSSGVLTIFNPAPKLSELDNEFYTNADIFVLNMEEAASLLNTSVRTQQEAEAACSLFHKRGVHRVVITMRENGAVGSVRDLQSSTQTGNLTNTVFHAPARSAKVVDTTGAGDALAGAMAFFLASYPHLSFEEIVTRSVAIATQTVEIEGVQKSYPSRASLPDELFT